MTVRVLHGDCREVLKTLPAESVHCVVTSPPYFGLRDYGTAIWEGGDPVCDHLGPPMRTNNKPSDGSAKFHGGNTRANEPVGRECPKCGARRIDSQIGLEPTPDAYVAEMVAVFREIRRVLRTDGVVWLNLGDSYATGAGSGRSMGGAVFGKQNTVINQGSYPVCQPNWMPLLGLKPKDLIGIPWRVAFALQADGWYLRQDIIWAKPNPMPESVRDRCTKSHEYVFVLTKSSRYFWDAAAISEPNVEPSGSGGWQSEQRKILQQHPRILAGRNRKKHAAERNDSDLNQRIMYGNGRNRRSVWTITTQPFAEAHFATMPPGLAELCIKAGTSERGCCPECGAPWVRVVEKIAGTNQTLDRPKRTAGMDSRTSTLSMSGGSQGWQSLGGKTIALGWQPSCSCPERQPVPCTVLDPFGGAGTTGLVADRLQRDAILIELNSDYAAMAEKRIHNDAPLFADAAE